ncbi:hypothetical protein SLEP1_g48513 [Rubroshorea leprosula]|uniref:Uncharacterized protein n=1 Tax=Rubroshorea leprosula TaxID=152421 RepID=A0AAV5LV00_9ROSI|nr:hypothetical protein SLEP1_g48513 [Rubroshorea leprosula]
MQFIDNHGRVLFFRVQTNQIASKYNALYREEAGTMPIVGGEGELEK